MAINSSSTVKEILEDERARKIMVDYIDSFTPENPMLGQCATMKIKTVIRFPQSGLSKEQQKELCERLDALDV